MPNVAEDLCPDIGVPPIARRVLDQPNAELVCGALKAQCDHRCCFGVVVAVFVFVFVFLFSSERLFARDIETRGFRLCLMSVSIT